MLNTNKWPVDVVRRPLVGPHPVGSKHVCRRGTRQESSQMRQIINIVARHAQRRVHQDRVADRLEAARPVEMAVPIEVHRQRPDQPGDGTRRADGQRRVGHAFEDHG